MADARKDRRTLLSLKIRYKSATLEDFIERYSMDISRGGVFIKAKKPLAVGTLLKFEFMLQDQSTLIHGVGRVAWRREEADADANNPSGMGIKFIKMDSESRSVVQRIVEERGLPGVFDQGKDGAPAEPATLSEPGNLGADQTKVRHVSEFLASAMEEGGAGATARNEAQAGAQRARQASSQLGSARGAFSAPGDSAGRQSHSTSDAPSRGAMSAFGGSSVSASASAGFRSSAAPAMDELDDDDFLDDETTKVQELPTASEFPDAAATVVAAESPFAVEKRQTPVVPASESSRLEEAVPDLFGPDSFGPAPGELIDASLLDPAVATVPPKASALPRGAVPEAAGIPVEAFKVPQAPAPVAAEPLGGKKKSRVGLLLMMLVLLLVAGGVGAWQLGMLDDVVAMVTEATGLDAWVPATGKSAVPAQVPARPTSQVEAAADPAAAAAAPAAEVAAEAAARDEAANQDVSDDSTAKAAGEAPATADAAGGIISVKVVSVPKGAFVSINGKSVGRTPLTVEYEAGTKLSLFSKARGYLARRAKVVVDPSAPEVKLVLAPLPFVVEVVTDPSGARASAVGGGQVTTPGNLKFRTFSGSRDIVISKDGYKTVAKSVSRNLFVEEKNQMAASVRVTLAKDATAAPAAEPVEAEEPAPAPAAAAAPEPVPVEEVTPAAESDAPAPAEAPATEAPSADVAP